MDKLESLSRQAKYLQHLTASLDEHFLALPAVVKAAEDFIKLAEPTYEGYDTGWSDALESLERQTLDQLGDGTDGAVVTVANVLHAIRVTME